MDAKFFESLINLSEDKKNQLVRFSNELIKTDFILIKEIVIENPPTKWTKFFKKQKYDSKGKLVTKQVFYLTANLFYADRTSFHITSEIIQDTKEFLLPYLKGIPELEKMKTEMVFYLEKDVDLDNRWYFFYKLILDILKKPTQKQIDRAAKYKKNIITTNTVYDDNTKYVGGFNCDFEKGPNKIVFRIYGRVKSEQKELDLFFK